MIQLAINVLLVGLFHLIESSLVICDQIHVWCIGTHVDLLGIGAGGGGGGGGPFIGGGGGGGGAGGEGALLGTTFTGRFILNDVKGGPFLERLNDKLAVEVGIVQQFLHRKQTSISSAWRKLDRNSSKFPADISIWNSQPNSAKNQRQRPGY